MHALLFTYAQVKFYELIKKMQSEKVALLATILMSSNELLSRIMMRTFSNSIETCFLMIGLNLVSQIPVSAPLTSLPAFSFTALVSIATMMRNSSLVFWIPIILFKALFHKNILLFILTATTVALPIIGLSLGADMIYYGKFTITPLNFINFNVLTAGSDFFGVRPSIFYLTDFILIYLKSLTLLYPFAFLVASFS